MDSLQDIKSYRIRASPRFDKIFFLVFCGCLFGFGSFLVLMLTFLSAYFSKEKATFVTINSFGEMNYELFMIFFLFCFFIICLIYGLKRIFSKENK